MLLQVIYHKGVMEGHSWILGRNNLRRAMKRYRRRLEVVDEEAKTHKQRL